MILKTDDWTEFLKNKMYNNSLTTGKSFFAHLFYRYLYPNLKNIIVYAQIAKFVLIRLTFLALIAVFNATDNGLKHYKKDCYGLRVMGLKTMTNVKQILQKCQKITLIISKNY